MISFIKNYLPIILAVLCIAGIVFGIYKISTIESKPVLPTVFTRGTVNENTGEHEKSDKQLVTKDFIECKGLEIEPKFDTNLTYQIFWYNEDKIYFGHTDSMNQKTKFTKSSVPEQAIYCHVVICPELYDKDGNIDPDAKIAFYEPIKYAIKLSIKVNIEQKLKTADLVQKLKNNTANVGQEITLDSMKQYFPSTYFAGIKRVGGITQLMNFSEADIDYNGISSAAHYSVYKVKCTDIQSYKLSYADSPYGTIYFYFYSSNGNVIDFSSAGNITTYFFDLGKKSSGIEIVVPDGADYMILSVPNNTENKDPSFRLSEYLPKNQITKNYYSN